MAKGLLFASFDTSSAREDEFNDWYDLEHVPERLRVPGFLNAQRWVGDDNPKFAVATYDLESHAVMGSPAYQAIGGANGSVWTKRITAIAKRLLRFEGTQIVPGDETGPAARAMPPKEATRQAAARPAVPRTDCLMKCRREM